MEPAIFPALDIGTTVSDEGETLPTVVIDASGHPEVSDLARVHAVEGVGDLTTDAARIETEVGDALLLGIRMTTPVQATFVVVFDAEAHRPLLDDVAAAGRLVIAHTPPDRAELDQPTWLAIDLDGDALRATLLSATP